MNDSSSNDVDLGSLPKAGRGSRSGINLRDPADSGITLEKKPREAKPAVPATSRRPDAKPKSVPPPKPAPPAPAARPTGGPITLGCPSCDKRFRARGESAGKKVKCPYCQAAVQVPTREEIDQPAAPPIKRVVELTPITVHCGSCKKRFRARGESAGKKVKCPYCQAAVSVPSDEMRNP